MPHGGPNRAVYAYSLTNYPFWQEHLGRGVLEPGSFGENFTVEGLTDTEVNVGDRFRVGSALVEVGPGDALELVHHDPEPLTAPTPGQALLCCSSPRTDLVLDL